MSDKHRFDDTDFREVIPKEEKPGKAMLGADVDSAEESEAEDMDSTEELDSGGMDLREESDSEDMDSIEGSDLEDMDFLEEAESEGVDLIEFLGLRKGNGKDSPKASAAGTKGGGDASEESEYEDICYICHRPESKAGAMIKVASKICICSDCMQICRIWMRCPGGRS